MKKQLLISVIKLGAGVILGLDPKQARIRAHMLEEVDIDHELPETRRAYRTTSPTNFKTGEVIYTAEALPKRVAQSVYDGESGTAKGASKKPKKDKKPTGGEEGKKEGGAPKKVAKKKAAKKKVAKKRVAKKKAAPKKAAESK